MLNISTSFMKSQKYYLMSSIVLLFFILEWLIACLITCCQHHYQKIDKYKRKYRGNIFVNNFPRDFTDGNIPSVKSLVKLFIMSITKGITDGIFRRYFLESSITIHFPIALLSVVLYGQNHRRI